MSSKNVLSGLPEELTKLTHKFISRQILDFHDASYLISKLVFVGSKCASLIALFWARLSVRPLPVGIEKWLSVIGYWDGTPGCKYEGQTVFALKPPSRDWSKKNNDHGVLSAQLINCEGRVD
jgi:hypothetical protein